MTRQDELNEAWCKYMGKFSTEIMHALAFALRWCDQHPNWISVEDELPKIETEVLMVSSGCTDTLCGYRCKAGKNGWYCYNDDDYWHNITHWMPMPLPPEKLSSLERTGKNWKEKKGGEQ